MIKGLALLVQLLKAIHQACLDNGRWHNAALMMPVEDPLQKPIFGGDLQELDGIASYRKAVEELRGWDQRPGRVQAQEDQMAVEHEEDGTPNSGPKEQPRAPRKKKE